MFYLSISIVISSRCQALHCPSEVELSLSCREGIPMFKFPAQGL
jgi:hypothetical protein